MVGEASTASQIKQLSPRLPHTASRLSPSPDIDEAEFRAAGFGLKLTDIPVAEERFSVPMDSRRGGPG